MKFPDVLYDGSIPNVKSEKIVSKVFKKQQKQQGSRQFNKQQPDKPDSWYYEVGMWNNNA